MITEFKDYRDLPFSEKIQDELFSRHSHAENGEIVYTEKDVLILLQMMDQDARRPPLKFPTQEEIVKEAELQVEINEESFGFLSGANWAIEKIKKDIS